MDLKKLLGECEGWENIVGDEIHKDYFDRLNQGLIDSSEAGHHIVPDTENIFRSLKVSRPENVKVVIIGQDPYPTPGVANGLAFAVNEDINKPASLKNIFKELKADRGGKPPKRTLLPWAQQGVLLLNRSLTTVAGKPGFHGGLGWSTFTENLVANLSDYHDYLVFILWGNKAKSIKTAIDDRHGIVEAAHPSPMSANNGFFGSRPFSKANKLLKNNGRKPVCWSKKGTRNG